MRKGARHRLPFIAVLATLALRALTPDGYMPAATGSGLLFELCPDGVPAAFMRALGGGHHHHHGDQEAAPGTDTCPIGHMLNASVAADSDRVAAPQILTPVSPQPLRSDMAVSVRSPIYRSRAPPGLSSS